VVPLSGASAHASTARKAPPSSTAIECGHTLSLKEDCSPTAAKRSEATGVASRTRYLKLSLELSAAPGPQQEKECEELGFGG
jgi:hypothetical protein